MTKSNKDTKTRYWSWYW